MHIVEIKYKDGSTERRQFFSKYNAQNFMSEKKLDMQYGTDNPKIDDLCLGIEVDQTKYAVAKK